jgi:hypothetical protein
MPTADRAFSEPNPKEIQKMSENPTTNTNPNTLTDRAIRARAQQGGPKGDRLAGYVGPGSLRPGAGKLVQRSGQPLYCGAMAGIAMAVAKHPNSKDASRLSTRFVGDCLAILHDGKVVQVGEFYLPGTLTRIVEAALSVGGGGVPFSVEIWAEPDPDGRPPSPLGYSYVTYNRRERAPNDPVLALAYASGLIEQPAADSAPLLLDANGAQEHADEEYTSGIPDVSKVDPETGEPEKLGLNSLYGKLAQQTDRSEPAAPAGVETGRRQVSGKRAAAT